MTGLGRLQRAALAACALSLAVAHVGLPANAQRRLAVLIGVQKYDTAAPVRELPFAENDALAMQNVLKEANWETELLIGRVTRRQILSVLQKAENNLDKDDQFLLFFAGHGVRDVAGNGQTYWLTTMAEPHFLDYEGIRVDHLMDFVSDIPAEKKLLLLDHCFGGDVEIDAAAPLDPNAEDARLITPAGAPRKLGRSRAYSTNELAAPLTQPARSTVVIAAARDYAFEDDDKEQGIFTGVLLQAFGSVEASEDEQLTVMELRRFVRDQMEAHEQEPAFNAVIDDLQPWVLAEGLSPGAAAAPWSSAAEADDMLSEWDTRNWLPALYVYRCSQAIEEAQNDFELALDANLSLVYDDLQEYFELVKTAGTADEKRALVKRLCKSIAFRYEEDNSPCNGP